jgi:hypothetical protein
VTWCRHLCGERFFRSLPRLVGICSGTNNGSMKAESSRSCAFHHELVLDLPNSCIGVLTCIGALGCLVLPFPSVMVPAACCYKVCDKVVVGFMIS